MSGPTSVTCMSGAVLYMSPGVTHTLSCGTAFKQEYTPLATGQGAVAVRLARLADHSHGDWPKEGHNKARESHSYNK